MNINLIYEGKNYNFDIPNDVTLDYLKELSSKIFNSEKELLDLIYNNKKLSDDNNNILIRDLIPEGESNVVLTVQTNNKNMNINTNKNKKRKESKKFFEYLKERDSEETIKEKKILKEEENPIIIKNKHEKLFLENLYNNNKNLQSKIRLMLTNNKINTNKELNKKEKFNHVYIQKHGELLGLIRQFSDKIKKIYLILYNKYKISSTTSSSHSSTKSITTTARKNSIDFNTMDNSFYELALYEKKIMNYLEIQIQHYKKLIETMQTYDNNNINFSKLSEFYKKLFMFNSEEINHNKENINNENNNDIKRKLINNNSSIDLSSFKSINFKLPSLKLKNLKSIMTKETKNEKNLKKILFNSNLNKSKEAKFKKSFTVLSRNSELENDINNNNNSSDENINKKNNNNQLDNISEKNSKEIDQEYKNLSPLNLRKTISLKKEKSEESDFVTPLKDLRLNQRKDSVGSSLYRYNRLSMDKKDFDLSQNKTFKKIKEINVSSMTIKDSNFTLEKKSSNKDKKKSLNKYDYVM